MTILAQPSRLLTVPCIPSESQYRSPKHFATAKDLEANTLYKFGIVADGRWDGAAYDNSRSQNGSDHCRSAKVELKAVAHGFAETHIYWDWVQPNAKKEGAVGESITLYRTGNFDGPGGADTEFGQLADGERKLDSAVIQLESGVNHGPYPMFPLWKPPEALFSCGGVESGAGRFSATHRSLPCRLSSIERHQSLNLPTFTPSL